MKLFIPKLGTRLRLLEDWEFDLYEETRNSDIWEALTKRKAQYYSSTLDSVVCMLEAGTVLSVARIYIRQGQTDYNSVTFNIIETKNRDLIPIKKGGNFEGTSRRFWVTLDDANELQVEEANA